MFFNLLMGAVGAIMLDRPDNSDLQKTLGGSLVAISLNRFIGGIKDVA